MSPIRRRRPLLRAAVVGGGAYVAGKASARHSAEREAREQDQEARLSDLEAQQAPPEQQQYAPQPAQQQYAPQPAAAPAPAAPPAGPSIIDQLNQLAELHSSGALSDEEFTAAKAKLLG